MPRPASVGDVFEHLEPAVVVRLVAEHPDDPAMLRFNHALIREVLMEDMTSLRRARLHLQVADAIEAGPTGVDDVEILAEHLWRASPIGVGARAAAALGRAADVALQRVAYASAEDLLTRAVQLRRATSVTHADFEEELATIRRLLEVAVLADTSRASTTQRCSHGPRSWRNCSGALTRSST